MMLSDKAESGLPKLFINPLVLFRQAGRVMRYQNGNLGWLLIFGRKTKTEDGRVWQIAAYPCDCEGQVDTWRYRYDVSGDDLHETARKLLFLIANDLIPLHHIENL